jgi:hypothetical protein
MSELLEGRCACGAVRYRMIGAPMFVHCCHCLDCQRQTKLWPPESLARRKAIFG